MSIRVAAVVTMQRRAPRTPVRLGASVLDMNDFPLLIEFAPHTTLHRQQDLVSHFPIVRNGPAGTFVVFPDGLRVSLPTDQIVFADDADGRARVGFGGMSFAGTEEGRLIFLRVRDLLPEDQ